MAGAIRFPMMSPMIEDGPTRLHSLIYMMIKSDVRGTAVKA